MPSFELDILFVPGVAIFLATLLATLWITGSAALSLLAALVKAGTFLLYFGVLFDGTFTFLDDWSYLDIGRVLYAEGVTLGTLVQDWDNVTEHVGGFHFVYYLYNAYAIRLFGDGYHAPVALNILLTIPIALIGATIGLREFKLDGFERKLFYAFLLFHPDIFAWSNVMNGKDIMVLLLHAILVLSISLFFEKKFVLSLVLAIPAVVLLFYLRFYVPVLFVSALLAGQLTTSARQAKWHMVLASGLGLLVIVGFMGGTALQSALQDIESDILNPVYGFIHFILTPIPFNTQTEYSFLDIPALIHWLLIPPAVRGLLIVLNSRSEFTRFFLAYLVLFFGLYSVFGELHGSRHRVQLDLAWAVLQFLGLKYYFGMIRARISPRKWSAGTAVR